MADRDLHRSNRRARRGDGCRLPLSLLPNAARRSYVGGLVRWVLLDRRYLPRLGGRCLGLGRELGGGTVRPPWFPLASGILVEVLGFLVGVVPYSWLTSPSGLSTSDNLSWLVIVFIPAVLFVTARRIASLPTRNESGVAVRVWLGALRNPAVLPPDGGTDANGRTRDVESALADLANSCQEGLSGAKRCQACLREKAPFPGPS
jgi:hypothetical protein